MKEINTDICIIGGGAAGLSMAAGAAQMGANTVLFESGEMGGDCLNYGCIPSKTLIANAKTAFQASNGRKKGILTSTRPDINFDEIKQDLLNVIAKIAPHDSKERFEELGVRVTSPYSVNVWLTNLVSISCTSFGCCILRKFSGLLTCEKRSQSEGTQRKVLR